MSKIRDMRETIQRALQEIWDATREAEQEVKDLHTRAGLDGERVWLRHTLELFSNGGVECCFADTGVKITTPPDFPLEDINRESLRARWATAFAISGARPDDHMALTFGLTSEEISHAIAWLDEGHDPDAVKLRAEKERERRHHKMEATTVPIVDIETMLNILGPNVNPNGLGAQLLRQLNDAHDRNIDDLHKRMFPDLWDPKTVVVKPPPLHMPEVSLNSVSWVKEGGHPIIDAHDVEVASVDSISDVERLEQKVGRDMANELMRGASEEEHQRRLAEIRKQWGIDD